MNEMQSGIELGKKQLKAVMNTINSNIEMGAVINAGPFLWLNLKAMVLPKLFQQTFSKNSISRHIFANSLTE